MLRELAAAERVLDTLPDDLKRWTLVGEEGSILSYQQQDGGLFSRR